jgi:hypothetical protein
VHQLSLEGFLEEIDFCVAMMHDDWVVKSCLSPKPTPHNSGCLACDVQRERDVALYKQAWSYCTSLALAPTAAGMQKLW